MQVFAIRLMVLSGDGNGISRVRDMSCSQTSSRSHVSTGLGTMLFGVSGNCEEREVTSLPDEFPKEPDSE